MHTFTKVVFFLQFVLGMAVFFRFSKIRKAANSKFTAFYGCVSAIYLFLPPTISSSDMMCLQPANLSTTNNT